MDVEVYSYQSPADQQPAVCRFTTPETDAQPDLLGARTAALNQNNKNNNNQHAGDNPNNGGGIHARPPS